MKLTYITIIIVSAIVSILGTNAWVTLERIKTNEALINNMSKEMKANTAKINTFLEDVDVAESWANSIYNFDNQPFVLECAFVFGVPVDSVTQDMFNTRYLIKQIQQQKP